MTLQKKIFDPSQPNKSAHKRSPLPPSLFLCPPLQMYDIQSIFKHIFIHAHIPCTHAPHSIYTTFYAIITFSRSVDSVDMQGMNGKAVGYEGTIDACCKKNKE